MTAAGGGDPARAAPSRAPAPARPPLAEPRGLGAPRDTLLKCFKTERNLQLQTNPRETAKAGAEVSVSVFSPFQAETQSKLEAVSALREVCGRAAGRAAPA